jgi:hypothetical protein
MTFEVLSGPYVITGEPCAAFHWRGWATLTGPLEPPGFAPTGRRWEVDGGDFYEFRDGRVCKVRTAYDVLSVSRQLGLLPPAGGRGERTLAMAQRSASRLQQAIQKRRRGLRHDPWRSPRCKAWQARISFHVSATTPMLLG